VLAGQAWDAKPEVMKLLPASKGSYENYLHTVAQEIDAEEFFVPSLNKRTQPGLSMRRGHRAVGVVYQTSYEARGHNYVPTDLAGRYDSFVFIDHTSALHPIQSRPKKGLFPETWPVGE
jgi:erythromycin esterase